jgi:hypothetical protein
MREIDQPQDAEYHCQSNSHEGVQTDDAQSIDKLLENIKNQIHISNSSS